MEFKIKAYGTLYGKEDTEIVLKDYDDKNVELTIKGETIGIVSREEIKRIAKAL